MSYQYHTLVIPQGVVASEDHSHQQNYRLVGNIRVELGAKIAQLPFQSAEKESPRPNSSQKVCMDQSRLQNSIPQEYNLTEADERNDLIDLHSAGRVYQAPHIVAAFTTDNIQTIHIPLVSATHLLSQDEILRRRSGISRLMTAKEFKEDYRTVGHELASKLEEMSIPSPPKPAFPAPHSAVPHYPSPTLPERTSNGQPVVLTESTLHHDDILVDTPVNVIQKAIDREVAQYAPILQGDDESRKRTVKVDFSQLPRLGSTIPNIVDLEAPLEQLKRDRFLSLMARPVPTNNNAITTDDMPQLLSHYTMLSKEPNSSRRLDPLSPDSVILRIALFDPITQDRAFECCVLDSQPLSAIRDAFDLHCLADHCDLIDPDLQVPREVEFKTTSAASKLASHEPYTYLAPPPSVDIYTQQQFLSRVGHSPHPLVYKLPHPSAFFFINNTFYDDLRSPLAYSLSNPIMQYSIHDNRHTHGNIGILKQSSMETLLRDVPLRIGEHYLYQHQGHCRHVLVILEMRMANPRYDLNLASLYPIVTYRQRYSKQPKCVCCESFSNMIVYGDKSCPTSPATLCMECFDMMHKDESGQLLYDDFEMVRLPPLQQPYTLPLKKLVYTIPPHLAHQ